MNEAFGNVQFTYWFQQDTSLNPLKKVSSQMILLKAIKIKLKFFHFPAVIVNFFWSCCNFSD